MIKDEDLVIPESLKGFQILSTVKNANHENLGILIMGKNTDKEKYIEDIFSEIRIYLLGKSDSKYHVENELVAFAFHDLKSAYEFVVKLPNMSALDILIMMTNPKLESEIVEYDESILQ